ncbi:MAG: methyltransferase domain-containing protein [Chitinophagaceae bacterium]|nr:MAG: arsenite S-adenosylmethyltransferase [Bacteroidetes bacterium OLB11]MCC6448624.1 methyltransferase domain-containing protein [Chitinophagaceae bacterium]HMN33062.1 class I SAM-dependent methyltransferase [Chitinophagaceae bacterium]
MFTENLEKAQGHWILARMGKKVLRPGGKELTLKLINSLQISPNDEVVEFAPGIGYTASIVLKLNPLSYIGIDADTDVVKNLSEKFSKSNCTFQLSNAAKTPLASNSKDKIYGEAMLTMQADHRKAEIIREAHRVLKKGGLYAIHELGLVPDELSDDMKSNIQRDLALSIKVNARPLTQQEWIKLIENEGFEIKKIETNQMRLLDASRMIDDEGFFNTLKIGYNIFKNSIATKRVMEMRSVFKKYQKQMNAIVIVAQKL